MAAVTEKPNKKPYQEYSQHDVINFFAHVSGTVNAGTFVIATVGSADSLPQVIGASHPGVPNRASSVRYSNPNKVRSTTSGEVPLGMTLNDVRETNAWGERYIYHFDGLQATDTILSGNSVPILTKGIVEINGFSGTPGPMSGAIAHPTVEGQLLVSNATTGQIGKFLTTSGADGYALFKIEL